MRHDRDELNAKVQAVNLANKCANEIAPKAFALFRPMVGQKILKVDFTFLKSVQDAIKSLQLLKERNLQIWINTNLYAIYLNVKASSAYDGITHYHEASVRIGEMDNAYLKTIAGSYEEKKCDYNVDQVIADRDTAFAAMKAYHDARSACFPFEHPGLR